MPAMPRRLASGCDRHRLLGSRRNVGARDTHAVCGCRGCTRYNADCSVHVGTVSYCSRMLSMPRGNPSPKLAITIDPKVHQKILAAAARDGVSVSAWMTSAAREALQRRAGLATIAEWEKEHGPLSAEEMTEARRSVRGQLRTVRRSA